MKDWTLKDRVYDCLVIGGGHAGCEAALAAARLGVKTLLLTLNTHHIAAMPCNPSIGGPGKGHLVRELACLGGEMPRVIDKTLIQLRQLNESRGPAVRSLRAQADKHIYSRAMKWVLENQVNLEIRQGEAREILVDSQNRVMGIKTLNNQIIEAPRVILCTGVYLKGKIIVGEKWTTGGPNNQRSSQFLSDSLRELGFKIHRLQTATPPRVLKSSIDFSTLTPLEGDESLRGFSFPEKTMGNQVPCYLTETNPKTMKILSDNLKQSPLKIGNITDSGPKHCPSIDRKFINFPEKTLHHIFLEPEGRDNNEIYLQGLTTALPVPVQEALVRSVRGLEKGHIVRYGYAIEYDSLVSTQCRLTLETLEIKGLYSAGQINGSTGYEEAASQGFIAGVNAALSFLGKPPFILSRTESYLGVLIEDLIREERKDPYRMTPSRAEFRLHLRMENAILRLAPYGISLGLLNPNDAKCPLNRGEKIEQEIQKLLEIKLNPTPQILESLIKIGESPIKKSVSLADLLTRPSMSYGLLQKTFPHLPLILTDPFSISLLEENIQYSGYLKRQENLVHQVKFYDTLHFHYPFKPQTGLSPSVHKYIEERKPLTLGQLMRGVDLSSRELILLTASLKSFCHGINEGKNEREYA